MYINGKWLSETEIQAYISELKGKIAERDKFIHCVRSYYSETISWEDLFEEDYSKFGRDINVLGNVCDDSEPTKAYTKLKPCPFCGSEAEIPKKNFGRLTIVRCPVCDIRTPPSLDEEKAIKAWNRRAEATAAPTLSKEEALEPEYEGSGYDDNGEIIYDMAYCPICHQQYDVDYDSHDNYCRNCGQKLDWNRAESEQEGECK